MTSYLNTTHGDEVQALVRSAACFVGSLLDAAHHDFSETCSSRLAKVRRSNKDVDVMGLCLPPRAKVERLIEAQSISLPLMNQ